MCGNIKKLRFADRAATPAEIEAAVLQYVRKISDVRQPSAANKPVFDAARAQIEAAVHELLGGLKTRRAQAVAKASFRRLGGA